jgi:pimeloyl-ACP methyl ester carboxylesterase
MILWGREDTWIPVDQGKLLHNMVPGSVFHIVPDAGHLVIEERPNQLIEKIRPFLHNEDII